MAQAGLSRVGEIVQRHDPDRFFTALFAPPVHRDTLFTLYAFNHELARASEVAREPVAALIRLQWWREVVEGARRRHEVAEPLGAALDAGRLLATDLAGMIDAREAEVDGIPDRSAFIGYVDGTAGGVMVAAGRALGLPDPEFLRRPGAAYGVSGVLRNAGMGRIMLPDADGDPEEIRQMGVAWLGPRLVVPRPALAAALPLVLARRWLRRRAPVWNRLAVLSAAMRGRV